MNRYHVSVFLLTRCIAKIWHPDSSRGRSNICSLLLMGRDLVEYSIWNHYLGQMLPLTTIFTRYLLLFFYWVANATNQNGISQGRLIHALCAISLCFWVQFSCFIYKFYFYFPIVFWPKILYIFRCHLLHSKPSILRIFPGQLSKASSNDALWKT